MPNASFRVSGELGMDGAQFFREFQSADAAVRRFGKSVVSNIGNRLAGAFSLGSMAQFARKIVDTASRLQDMADRTDVSVEELQRLDRATKENGTSLEALISFWEKLRVAREKALRDPSGAESSAFSRLGISRETLASKANSAELTRQIATTFQNSGNIEQLGAPLRAIGVKGVGELVGVFRAGLDAMYQDVVVMSTETVAQLDELGDRWSAFTTDLTASSAPIFTMWLGFAEKMQRVYGAIFSGVVQMWESLKNGGGLRGGDDPLTAFWKEIHSATKEFNERKSDESAEKKARRERLAELRNKSLSWGELDLEQSATKFKQDKNKAGGAFSPLASDSLIRVGNFFGQTGNLPRTAERQLDELRQIKTHTARMAAQAAQAAGAFF